MTQKVLSPQDQLLINALSDVVKENRKIMKLPKKKYAVIYADPPWAFKTYSAKGQDRAAEKHYDTMSIKDICAIPVADICEENCVLLMWVTMPMLENAFKVIEAWGFKYKTVAFTWMKQNKKTPTLFIDAGDIFMGAGYWTRANAEIAILATRGRPRRRNSDVAQAIFAPRREHSRKPTETYERIERLLNGPYIELFSRTKRAGWDMVGNQVGKFTTPAPNHGGDSAVGNPQPRKKRKTK